MAGDRLAPTGWCMTGQHEKTETSSGCPIISPLSGRQCGCDCHTEGQIDAARAVWLEKTGGVDMTWGSEPQKGRRRKSNKAPEGASAPDETSTSEQDAPAGQIEDEERDALEDQEVDAGRREGPGEGIPEGPDVDAGARDEARDLA